MKDFVKQELEVGDFVVHGVGGPCGGLSGPYEVLSFTPKMVRIGCLGERSSKLVPPRNLVKVAQ